MYTVFAVSGFVSILARPPPLGNTESTPKPTAWKVRDRGAAGPAPLHVVY